VSTPLPPLPPMQRPPAGGLADQRAFRRRRAMLIGLLVLLVAATIAIVVVATSSGGSSGGSAGAPFDGTVYVESNSKASGTGSILAFRYREGSFRPLNVREYPTGGSGSADLSNSGALDVEGQIALNDDRTLLFAVNTGSDTIAAFHVAGDGALTPVKGSPFPSQGRAPASVSVRDDTLVVANKAHDGVRDELLKQDASYAAFRIAGDGSLTPLGRPIDAPPGSSPTQAYAAPGTDLMFSTEEAGPWRAFKIGPDGLTQAPGSPHALEARVFAPLPRRGGVWAQGISKHPSQPLLYAGVANIRKLVTYSFDSEGRLTLVDAQPDVGAVLPCWTAINADGTRLYTGNAGSQNISVYDIATDPRHPRQIQRVTLNGKGNPWNFQIDPSGRYLFMDNMRAVRQIPPGTGNTLHSFRIDADGRLSELPDSPVPIPVPLGTNPWGMAIVPRR
jgi:hypothetical protein